MSFDKPSIFTKFSCRNSSNVSAIRCGVRNISISSGGVENTLFFRYPNRRNSHGVKSKERDSHSILCPNAAIFEHYFQTLYSVPNFNEAIAWRAVCNHQSKDPKHISCTRKRYKTQAKKFAMSINMNTLASYCGNKIRPSDTHVQRRHNCFPVYRQLRSQPD